MSEQVIHGSKGNSDKSNVPTGLTPGEQQRLEESMHRNDRLMRRLAKM